MEILLEPTSNKLLVDALVTRTASTAAKPCQEDSYEFYLITRNAIGIIVAQVCVNAAQLKLQKLVSQLELLDKKISQEDVKQKLLRSLSFEWNTHAIVWRNKADLDTMSMNDLYNNLKVYEPEVKGVSSSSSSTQNMAFVSSSNNNSSSTNGTVNTA
nr:ribonuclease H-like domain-containing protein [Tanacetum cinerariifolium]